ncbi:hypothetical protein LLEC1_05436 [Akanthomyces lecanii]|uniref:18S rRNA factor 2 n=1 Tax=Cordyceps confragosa TaxID=2714763 RepID=A0A179HZ54_CORDF|nr:hypothetical protein LLEC1_05436 [Akanthomyces lecanii]
MAPNVNDFLDASESDNDHIDTYDSDNEISKGGSRSTKRRKLSPDEDGDTDQDASDMDEDGGDDDKEDNAEGETESARDKEPTKKKTKLPKIQTDIPGISRPLARKNLVTSDKAVHRAGGNKKRSFTEGWVEFLHKRDAKAACELLNARTVGGKKGSYYRDDIWNLLYLRGFKWHNLTEQIATENAERASRMRAEISKTSRENKEFARNVEQGKVLDGIAKSAAARKRKAATDDGGEHEAAGEEAPKRQQHTRTFKQIPLAKKSTDTDEQPERVTRVLSKIF